MSCGVFPQRVHQLIVAKLHLQAEKSYTVEPLGGSILQKLRLVMQAHVQADLSQKGLVGIRGEYNGNIFLNFLQKARHSWDLYSSTSLTMT